MARVLIVDDERDITSALGAYFERSGHDVVAARGGAEALALVGRIRPDLVLLDVRLPDMTGFEVLEQIRAFQPLVIMMTGAGDVPMAVQAMQSGAESFLLKPVELAHLGAASERALEKARLRHLNRYLTERRGPSSVMALLGSSPAMRELAEQIELLASSEKTTVLLTGESGTGKGRVAEQIHRLSPRADRPFVHLNCAAFTTPALDAELFGRAQLPDGDGHFDGTVLRPGLAEVASSGTLFLEEVGDLDSHLQPKLLRLLEGESFRPVAGAHEVGADVRLIAATTKDLVTEVTSGRFREDLYYRLSVMPIVLPPLRARAREDLLGLIGHLMAELEPNLPASPAVLDDVALERMLKYAWPGNVREMRNVLERGMIMARGQKAIGPEHLPGEVRDASGAAPEQHVPRTLAEMERAHIERTLRYHQSNRTRAARELGISRATLIKKIKEFGLDGR